jgi:hypothetical protein
MISIQVHKGTKGNDEILYDIVKKEFSFPLENHYGSFDRISVSDLIILEIATEENVKSIDPSWDLSEAKSEIDRVSTLGAAFGILGLAGEIAMKGYNLTFIAKFKDGRKLLATVKSKAFEKMKLSFDQK